MASSVAVAMRGMRLIRLAAGEAHVIENIDRSAQRTVRMGGVAGPPRWGRGGARRKIVGPGWNATAGLGVVRAPRRSAPTKGVLGAYRGIIGTVRHGLAPYRARPNGRGEASAADASVKAAKK